MLSSDKNVETIAQLVEVLKHYFGLQKEYVKLDIIDKVVRLLTAAALALVFFLLLVAVMMFLSFGFAYWLSTYTGTPLAFVIVAALHLLLLLLFFAYRKPWIEKPLVKFLAGILMSD
jgi:lipopolysaccharide export LptBFGC system permease protein LptF